MEEVFKSDVGSWNYISILSSVSYSPHSKADILCLDCWSKSVVCMWTGAMLIYGAKVWTGGWCAIWFDHDDVLKWKQFPCYWPFVRGIHRSPVEFPHKDQWRGALMFSLACAWYNDWTNNRDAGDLRRHRAHYDVTVMMLPNAMLKLAENVKESRWEKRVSKSDLSSRPLSYNVI